MILLALLTPLMAQAAQYQTHKVQRGETLYRLSRVYNVSVDELKRLNSLPNDNLRIGQILKIKPLAVQPRPAPSTPTPPPTPGAAIDQASVQLPDDFYYVVKPQDNLYRISVNHNITLKDMLRWNGLADEMHVIKPGDRIIVRDPAQYNPEDPPAEATQNPPASTQASPPPAISDDIVEKVHIVQPKETLFRIATNNGLTVEELKRLNNLVSNDIRVGQRLFLTPRRPGSEDSAPSPSEIETGLQGSDRIRTDLVMPVDGKVSSEFGIRNGRPHKGIDIGTRAGTPIYAVLDGTVVFSGYQGAYGNVIVLEHPDFVMTVYAHNEKNLVNVGDQVSKGQMIGTIGATGDASGPHLHFEYRIKGKAINPRKVLPFDRH